MTHSGSEVASRWHSTFGCRSPSLPSRSPSRQASWTDARTTRARPTTSPTSRSPASTPPLSRTVLNYQPGVVVRRRYIGDSNGTLGMRGSNMFQTARAMVFADGVPLHNPLQTRWNGAPRWSLVAPDEVESAEVIYGPFSAEHSGNAMGGVVKFNTRLPEERAAPIRRHVLRQAYEFAGADDQLGGGRYTTSYGDRLGNFRFSLLHNHLDNNSQPQNFNRDEGSFGPRGRAAGRRGRPPRRERSRRPRDHVWRHWPRTTSGPTW